MGELTKSGDFVLIINHGDGDEQITKRLQAEFPGSEFHVHQLQKGEKREKVSAELWQKVTVLVTLSTFPEKLADAPNLRLIHLLSAGINQIQKNPIYTDTDISITTSSGIHGPPIAEWVLMALLGGIKKFGAMHEAQTNKQWAADRVGKQLMKTPDLVGKTVGIVGYGGLGRQIARNLSALAMHVHVYTAGSRSTDEDRAESPLKYNIPNTGDPKGTIPRAWYSGTTPADFRTFLRSGLDVIVLCVPLTPNTKSMLGPDEFEILYQSALERRPGSSNKAEGHALNDNEGTFIVNVSRGPVVVQDALIEYLNAGKLWGAALDVTRPEPLPSDSPLWTAKNTVITPHISGLSSDYETRSFDVFSANLIRLQNGEGLLNLVDRKKGY